MSNRVYLAGPDVFRADAEDYFDYLRGCLLINGLEPLTPIDNFINGTAKEIYDNNIRLIESCNYVMANLDPFRGPSVDPGTAVEIGYAKAYKKKIIGYYPRNTDLEYRRRVNQMPYTLESFDDLYSLVEDFSLSDNLMVVLSCNAIYNSLDGALSHIIKDVRKKMI